MLLLLRVQRKLTSKQPRRHCWKCGWNASTSGTTLQQLTGGVL